MTATQDLLRDEKRFSKCVMEHNGIYVDFARQRVTEETLDKLEALAEKAGLKEKIAAMFGGSHINSTEDRAVLHAALRAPASEVTPPRPLPATAPEDRALSPSALSATGT